MAKRHTNSHQPRRGGYRGGRRQWQRMVREPEYYAEDNPGWLGTLVLAGLAAGAAYVVFARPNLPGTWDEWLYGQIDRLGLHLPEGTVVGQVPDTPALPDDSTGSGSGVPGFSNFVVTT